MKHLPLLLLLGGLLSASAARSADPVRYVDAATLTVIGKALPTEQPYNRIDTTRFRVPAKTRSLKEELEKSKVIGWLIEMYVF